jgi:hypothetical protein
MTRGYYSCHGTHLRIHCAGHCRGRWRVHLRRPDANAYAERRYFATSGKYATLEELRANNDITIANRANYTYSAEIGDTTFKIIATYSGEDPHAPIRISMDESMDMKSE